MTAGPRIVLLTHHYEPEDGPPQRRWSAVVPALVAAGADVTVVTPQAHHPHGRADRGRHGRAAVAGRHDGRHGESVVRVPYVPLGERAGRARRLADQFLAAACSLAPAVRARPDLVVATVPALPTLPAAVAAAGLSGSRLALDVRDAWPDVLADARSGPPPVRALARGLIGSWQRRADVVVCVTDSFADALRERGIRDVETVRNGVALDRVRPAPPPPARRDALHVAYLGTVGLSQALHHAVTAVSLLPPGTVRLRVVGHGPAVPALIEQARRLGVADRVTVERGVAPGGVRELREDADTLLVSLRAWQAFEATVPSKLYEWLACGRHVSAALAGEAAGIVRRTGAGDVVPPEDPAALASLWAGLARDRSRLRVGSGGRRWVSAHADQAALVERMSAVLMRAART